MIVERLTRTRTPESPVRHAVPLDVLVVDDDETTRLSLRYALTDAGHRVTEAPDGETAMVQVVDHLFDAAIVDVRLPKVDGLSVFRELRKRSPSTAVILMTAFATVPDAVATLRDGAYGYVTKPFDVEEFSLRVIGHLAEHRGLLQELEEARRHIATRDAGSPIIGHTPSMRQLIERINTVALSDAPVLIRGEAGTGKELVAHTLHALSPRKNEAFVTVHCAAFPPLLIESELFGHQRGAFPGAVRSREGRFKAADGGSLLLDDVAELPLSVQAKLRRVLEEGAIEPLGTNGPLPVNVRVLSSTHRDLKELVARGIFREDLYSLLKVLDLDIPPLRERRADMPLLLAHFLRRFYPGRVPPSIAARAWSALMNYAFPGNVREFAHAIERAVTLSHGSEIDLEHLPPDVAGLGEPPTSEPPSSGSLRVAMRDFEKHYILRTLSLVGGKTMRAAASLGISRKKLIEKMKEHQIEDVEAEALD